MGLVHAMRSNGPLPQVKMFIHRAEEEVLGIDQNATEMYRRDNQIPDSDGFAMVMPKENSEMQIRDNVHQSI